MNHRLSSVKVLWIVGLGVLSAGSLGAEENFRDLIESNEVLSAPYYIDKKYKSMIGPFSELNITFGKKDNPELVWVTGFKAVMVNEDGTETMPQEFMCHSNLDFISIERKKKHRRVTTNLNRIFTLSQGQNEIRFPDWFGIPVMSDETLRLATQVLNLNLDNPDLTIRHKVTIEYVRDRYLKRAMTPLFVAGAEALVLVEGKNPYLGVESPDPEKHGPGCLIGPSVTEDQIKVFDDLGQKFSGHWFVPLGRSENTTLVTEFMKLPYDTTVHYIAVHLHPFAESLELRNRTTGETVFKSNTRNFSDRIGLDKVDSFSSAEGVPLFQEHEYEITSIYNNTSDEIQDAMAVMILFLKDKRFIKPRL